MSLKNTVLALFCGFFLSGQVHGEILFEAFYRIEKNGRHTGYVIQRVSSDKPGFKTVRTYVRTKGTDKDYFVTSKTVAKNGNGSPVESVHYSNNTGAPYRIHATFKNGAGTVRYYSNNSRKAGLTEKAKPAPFPSAFLFYTGDLAKVQPGKRYAYTAFAEEHGQTQIGYLSLLSAKETGGKRVLQLLNDDSGQPVENFVWEIGEPLGSRSNATGTIAYWVATKEEAVADMTYPTGEMTSLFGDLPQGKKNPWFKAKNLRVFETIKSFATWDGSRQISSQPASETLPLPVRGL